MQRLLVAFLIQISAFASAGYLYAYAPEQNPVTGDTVKKVAIDSVRAIELGEMKKNSDFKSEITYKASRYMLLDVDGKTLYLSDDGQLKYETMVLNADSVVVDWEKNTVSAGGKVDSVGQFRGRPVFDENGQKYNAESMSYNFKTQKGLVRGAKTKQGEEYVLANRVKKVDENTYYISDGKFTSCELDHPHYYIRSKRLKVVPRKTIVTGPVQLVIEDFPLPLVLPFGFFPNQTGKRSGIVMPTYGNSADRGFFLRDGGYYLAISDHLDLLLKGDIFSKGGWRLAGSTSYNKRYKYVGTLGMEYGFQRYGEPADGDKYREQRNFWVRWDHKQTISPQATLNASVNAGSSDYYSNNSYNEKEYLSNTLKSTVNFNQAFANSTWRLNVTLDHSQNTQTREMSLGLPTLAVTKGRFFPFKGANSTGDKWFTKIGASYSMNLKNQITAPDSVIPQLFLNPNSQVTLLDITELESGFFDTTITTKRGLDYFKNGISHSIPVSLQLNAFKKYVNIVPSLNLRDRWYIKEKIKTWNADSAKVLSEDRYGFFAAHDFDFSVNTSTRLYGIFNLKGARKTMLRHTLQPAIGYRYRPDYSTAGWNVFRTVQSDTSGKTVQYSRYEGALFGGPAAGAEQVMNMSINNVLELKLRSKEAEKDTTIKDPWTRITLLDAFSLSSSYNFAADSLKLAPLNMNARTNLLNNKLNVVWSGVVDPYAVNAAGQRIDTFRYALNGRIGRLSSMNLALGTRFQSKSKTGPELDEDGKKIPEDQLNDLQYFRDLYVDFNVPWNVSVNLLLNYTNTGKFRDTTLTVNFNGDVNLSPKWKVGFTSGYDFSNMDFSYTSISIYRDLHCWEMSMTWVPFGIRKSYNLSLNVKSSTLKDLKLTKRRDWQDRF